MRRIGVAILTAAAMLGASGSWAQSEMEQVTAGSAQLQADQREVIQRNIDVATAALQAKDYAAARKPAQAVTRADPKRVEAWLLLGAAQMGLEDWKKARAAYATAVRLSPGHAEARAGLGVSMARTGDRYATVQLAWLADKQQACGGCGQAIPLAKYRAQVEAAIAQGAKPS